jgi:hypothetical protein
MARKIKRRQAGTEPSGLRPDWRPLLAVAPDEVPDFMWMFRDHLEEGIVVEAYKHSWTRQYLHLDASGRAYEFVGEGYQEVDSQKLLARVLRDCDSRADIVRRNEWISGEGLRWTRSATRHRVPRAQSLAVIEHAGICFAGEMGRRGEPSVYFFGDDEDELPLEVVGYENSSGDLLVVHAMPLRRQFEKQYMEALRWRR